MISQHAADPTEGRHVARAVIGGWVIRIVGALGLCLSLLAAALLALPMKSGIVFRLCVCPLLAGACCVVVGWRALPVAVR